MDNNIGNKLLDYIAERTGVPAARAKELGMRKSAGAIEHNINEVLRLYRNAFMSYSHLQMIEFTPEHEKILPGIEGYKGALWSDEKDLAVIVNALKRSPVFTYPVARLVLLNRKGYAYDIEIPYSDNLGWSLIEPRDSQGIVKDFSESRLKREFEKEFAVLGFDRPAKTEFGQRLDKIALLLNGITPVILDNDGAKVGDYLLVRQERGNTGAKLEEIEAPFSRFCIPYDTSKAGFDKVYIVRVEDVQSGKYIVSSVAELNSSPMWMNGECVGNESLFHTFQVEYGRREQVSWHTSIPLNHEFYENPNNAVLSGKEGIYILHGLAETNASAIKKELQLLEKNIDGSFQSSVNDVRHITFRDSTINSIVNIIKNKVIKHVTNYSH